MPPTLARQVIDPSSPSAMAAPAPPVISRARVLMSRSLGSSAEMSACAK
jgi:hypothetical protein